MVLKKIVTLANSASRSQQHKGFCRHSEHENLSYIVICGAENTKQMHNNLYRPHII